MTRCGGLLKNTVLTVPNDRFHKRKKYPISGFQYINERIKKFQIAYCQNQMVDFHILFYFKYFQTSNTQRFFIEDVQGGMTTEDSAKVMGYVIEEGEEFNLGNLTNLSE
ncbi:hypothetical protein EDC96DRAFT_547125 [Choanephora cucurbitarum]|nr:hypothetical protein EDC96DRAFT_547125 [Choanephora cucurbitarum]